MQNIKFELSTLMKIYKDDNRTFVKSKEYVTQYFYLTSEANYYIWTGTDFQHMTKEAFTEVYLNRFPKEVKLWFKTENDKVYSTAIRINNIRVFQENGTNYINLFPGFKHDGKYKKFSEYSAEIQERANFFLRYIKEVLCNSNDEAYEYMKIITAGYCRGMKWDVALYLKTSAQGVGKSTFYEFLSEHVLGLKCCLSLDLNH